MALLISPSVMPDLITVTCPECQGDGYHLHDAPMLSTRCANCFGAKVTEVCAGCLEVPGVIQGVEVCGCVIVLGAVPFSDLTHVDVLEAAA